MDSKQSSQLLFISVPASPLVRDEAQSVTEGRNGT